MPNVAIYHRYHSRDIAVRNALYNVAKRILKQAGAKIFYYMPIVTFSHALGTCRMGKNRELSAVNPELPAMGYKKLLYYRCKCAANRWLG